MTETPQKLDGDFSRLDVVASKFAVTITKIDILAADNARTIRRSLVHEPLNRIAFSVLNCSVIVAHFFVSLDG